MKDFTEPRLSVLSFIAPGLAALAFVLLVVYLMSTVPMRCNMCNDDIKQRFTPEQMADRYHQVYPDVPYDHRNMFHICDDCLKIYRKEDV